MFSCEFSKISKNTFLQNTSGRLLLFLAFQRQPASRGVLWKRCCWKFRKIHKKTPLVCDLFYRTPLDEYFWLFRATLLKWGTANVWETSDEYSLPRSTNLRSTVISFLFFRQDKLSVYVFIGFTLLLPKAAIRVEVFCKKRCSKIFRKFHRKTPVLESLFDKVAGLAPILKNIYQRLLLHCTCTTHSYSSVLLYIQHLLHHHHCYQIQKASKNLNLLSHFHWSHFNRCYFF